MYIYKHIYIYIYCNRPPISNSICSNMCLDVVPWRALNNKLGTESGTATELTLTDDEEKRCTAFALLVSLLVLLLASFNRSFIFQWLAPLLFSLHGIWFCHFFLLLLHCPNAFPTAFWWFVCGG